MVKFRMIKIAVEQFAILADTLPSKDITFSVGLGFKYAVSERRIVCVFDIAFQSQSDKFLVLKTECEFVIHEQDWNTLVKNNTLTIPKALLEHLAVHTVGASRGILFCKTEGTPFCALILPPINVQKIITDDIVAQLQDSLDNTVD